MKAFAKIILMLLLTSACTPSHSKSDEAPPINGIQEPGNSSEPATRDQQPGNSNSGPDETATEKTPVQDKAPGDTTAPGEGNAPPPPSGGDNQATVEFGVLNFRQYLATLGTVTGVSANSPAAAAGGVAPMAETIRTRAYLPQSNSIPNFSFVQILSMIKLSSTYCDVLANNATLLEAKFPGLSLAELPSDSTAYATTLLTVFYGPETALQGPRATDIANVAAAVNTLKSLPEATGPSVFMASCAALLASAEIIML